MVPVGLTTFHSEPVEALALALGSLSRQVPAAQSRHAASHLAEPVEQSIPASSSWSASRGDCAQALDGLAGYLHLCDAGVATATCA
jgi:hypothetical protein